MKSRTTRWAALTSLTGTVGIVLGRLFVESRTASLLFAGLGVLLVFAGLLIFFVGILAPAFPIRGRRTGQRSGLVRQETEPDEDEQVNEPTDDFGDTEPTAPEA